MKPRAWNSTLPQRTAPLRSGGPLAKGGKPLGRAPLKPRSAKTAARYVIRRQIVAEMFRYPEVCEVPWCMVIATDPHEPLTRARGGDILDRDGIRKVCHYHNWLFGQCEESWMYELGFLIHSWDAPGGGEAA